MTLLKICGLTREEDAVYCAEGGADFLGFIFVPESPRFVDPERAARIVERVRAGSRVPRIVGVFRDASPDYVREIARAVHLDLVQCHGDETDEELKSIGIPAIQVLRVSTSIPDTASETSAEWLLFDTYDPQQAGGTGRPFDWSLLASYSRDKQFFLSGGINADNVAAAISLVRPDAVDVASGVESAPGIKDHEKLDRLFARVKG